MDVYVSVLDSHPLLSSFQLMLLEHIIMCRLITGNKSLAIKQVRIVFVYVPVFKLPCCVVVWISCSDSRSVFRMSAADALVPDARVADPHTARELQLHQNRETASL